ncbi:MAG: dockerin type I domain-containing protein [Phycisphaerales bacterium]
MSNRGLKSMCLLAACGAISGLGAHADAQPYLINISGATLQENFFSAPASTREFLDINGGGVMIPGDQLAPTFAAPGAPGGAYQPGLHWAVQYYAVGSGNGLKALIDYGRNYYTGGDWDSGEMPGTAPLSYLTASNAYLNRTRFVSGGAQTGIFNESHGGSSPLRSLLIPNLDCPPAAGMQNEIVSMWAAGGDPGSASPNSGLKIDIAPLDVPTIWFVRQEGGLPNWNLLPTQPGYGRNSVIALNPDGTATSWNNLLESLDSPNSPVPVNLNAQDANPLTIPDCNSLFDTRIANAPVAALTNFGVGYEYTTKTNLRYLLSTGRGENGENLMVITRDSGSGTRNAFNNSLCLDPSWGVGENIGSQNAGATNGSAGPTFLPSNKTGSGDMELTVVNHRLAVGYTGAERGLSGSGTAGNWLGGGKIEVFGVIDNLNGRAIPPNNDPAFPNYVARPTIENVVNNGLIGEVDPTDGSLYVRDGYRITGPATFVTIGDPRNQDEIGGEPGNLNPRLRNSQAAAYMNNVTRSLDAFNGNPNAPETDFTPGQLLGSRFISIVATDRANNLANPCEFLPNALRNQFVQDWISQGNRSPLQDPVFATYGRGSLNQITGRLAGIAPTRRTGFTYSDGVTGGATNFVSQSGALINYATQLSLRNKVAGDFSGDGVRDINDAGDMIRAWRERNGGPAWSAPGASGNLLAIATANGFSAPGADASIELLGDFTGDGNFGRKFNQTTMVFEPDRSDVRYWADGLALMNGSLNRAAGFAAVDNAWMSQTGSNNFFGTVLATGVAYAAGASVADVAGPSGRFTPGYNPIGADGRVDASDIDYVYRQFNQNPRVNDAELNWSDLDEAVGADLSADVTGDLRINQADIDRIVLTILGTSYGDVNLDGVCDATDLSTANANLGQPGGWAMGDIDGDGAVTAADITIIADCVGGGCPCDVNSDAALTSQDFFDFLVGFFNGTLDYNLDGAVTSQDFFDFLSCFFNPPTGC